MDVRNNKIHLGAVNSDAFPNKTLNGFLQFLTQNETEGDDGTWAVRIEDVMYGSAINGTSLDDNYSDLAVIDTMFPGLLIPDRVWNNFNKNIIKNITNMTGSSVVCNSTERIYGVDYNFCFALGKCNDINSKIFDIFLYFNATKASNQSYNDKNFTQYILSMKKGDYAVD